MTLSAFCACQVARVHHDLLLFEQSVIRRRWQQEWAITRAQLWAIVEARMNLNRGIARDIREWRIEP